MLGKYAFLGVIFQCITFTLIFASNSIAQRQFSVKEVEVELEFSNSNLSEVFAMIESATPFKFIYYDADISVHERFTLPRKNMKVSDVLLQISKKYNLAFKQVNNNISVKKLDEKDSRTPKLEIILQSQTITGRVTSTEDSEPLPGVNVLVKGTSQGTVTDMNGDYTLTVSGANPILVFSFIGYTTEEVAVGAQSVINLNLAPDITQLSEIVIVDVGYGTMRKTDLTGSISTVSGDELKKMPVSSVAEALTGRMAGVSVVTTEGSPDAEINIRVRGGGSITQDNSPLYIVDGFPVNGISDIAPSDIQSVSVLKDASSTAIYGSRGANGVVIVTTKRGREGKLSVSYNSYYGLKKIANTLDVLDVEDYVNWQYEYAVLEDGIDNLDSYEGKFGPYQDIDLYSGMTGNDWQRQVYGRTGNVFNHDLSLRGGTEKFMYSLSYARIDDKAIMVGSGFERNNISLKLDNKPNDKINLAFSLRYSDTEISGGGANEQNEISSADSRLKHAVTYTPIPLQGLTTDDTDEEIAGYLINPIIATADNDRLQQRKNYNIAGSFQWELLNNLQFKTELGLDNYGTLNNRFYGLTTYYIKNAPASENQGFPAVILRNGDELRFRNTNTLNYDFGDLLNESHNLKMLLGHEMIQIEETELTSVVHGFPRQFTSEESFKLTTQGKPFSTDNNYSPDDKLLSFFGRLVYDYQEKYLLYATYRADGSSKFAEVNRWGYFPSVAAAWRISKESFMPSGNWLNDLKIRASYGAAGNNNIPSGQMVQSYQSSTTSWMNPFNSFWAPSKRMANPDLKWETTYTRNVGIDFSLFKSRLSGTVEAYMNNTTDLLIEYDVQGTGYDTQFRNIGETENKGIEATLDWFAIDAEKYGLNFSFNIGYNRNRIKSLGAVPEIVSETGWASTEIPYDYYTVVGGQVGEMYGYVSDGRYEVSDFDYDALNDEWILKEGVADVTSVVDNPRPGVMKLMDLTGDNIITTDDRRVIGNANPKHTGGFIMNGYAYGFDLTASFNWSYGNDIYNANKIEYTTATPKTQYRNLISTMESGKRWTNIDPATGQLVNDPATLAAMNANTTMWSPYMDRHVFTDWAVEDGSFLRLNTLTLGYTLPMKLTERLGIENLRFYATGYNVFILTNYSGFDPEVSTRRKTPLTPGVDYSAYPRSRQVVFGLNLNF